MENLGIENLKKALHVGIAVGMTTAGALEDKKITLAEAFSFVPHLMEIPNVVSALPQIKAEIADLDADERTALNDYIQRTFDIANDKLEAVIEKGIAIVISLLDFASLYKQMKG